MKIQNIALASVVLLTLVTAASTAGSAQERNGSGNIICPDGQAVDVTGQNCADVPQSRFGMDRTYPISHRHSHSYIYQY